MGPRGALLGGIVVAALAGAAVSGQSSGRQVSPVTDAMLSAPSANDWLSWRGTSRSLGYSPLTQINRATVGQLKVAWTRPMNTGWQEAAPIVHDGVMYLAHNGGMVEALDAATGDALWKYAPPMRAGQTAYSTTVRGMAIYGSNVIVSIPEGRLVALDAVTGNEAWSTTVVTPGTGLRMATAPVVARGGKIVSGLSSCDRFIEEKCALVGHDAKTGKEIWRTATVPKPGTPGADTWGDLPYLYRSGTDMWIPGSYDPELNLVYWSTAQAKPWARGSRGTDGDALYSNSTLAIDPASGKIVWHRQLLPGETHDLDEVFENVLVDAGTRRSLFKVGKIGILWELDRRTGRILRGTDLGIQNIVDLNPETGAVKYRADKIPVMNTPIDYCPAPTGGKNWPSMAYSPEAQAFFIPYMHTCANMTFVPVEQKPGGGGNGGTAMRFSVNPQADGKVGVLAAVGVNGQALWKRQQRVPFVSAALTTAGGLVFVADMERYLYALDIRTGEVLWQTQLATSGHGFPASYAVNGRQYIAVPVGGNSVLEMYAPQLLPGFTPPKEENGLVVFALPSPR